MLSNVNIIHSENKIQFEVSKSGIYSVTLRRSDGKLLFERLFWELQTDVRYYILSEHPVLDSDLSINPFYPTITPVIDYSENKIYVRSSHDFKMNISLYDPVNNNHIWRCSHLFDGNQIWYSPSKKLITFSNLVLIVKDTYDRVLFAKSFENTKYTFCHIPKTGGTSIKKVLNISSGHEVFDKTKSNNFSFCFVRNPYDRFLSAYHYLAKGGLDDKDKRDKEIYLGDSDIDTFIKEKLKNSLTQQHLRPQHEYIPNGVDFVGKVENMQHDFNKICELLGIEPIDLPKENVGSKDHHLTDEQKEIIYQIYERDFIQFNYEK